MVKKHYQGVESKSLWERVYQYRKTEYANLCILYDIVLALSGSNSSVERAFSILGLVLTKRRLRMNHSLFNDLMLLKCNQKLWTEEETENIINAAVTKYLSKKRKRKLDDEYAPVPKIPRPAPIEIDDSEESNGESEYDSDSSTSSIENSDEEYSNKNSL